MLPLAFRPTPRVGAFLTEVIAVQIGDAHPVVVVDAARRHRLVLVVIRRDRKAFQPIPRGDDAFD